MKSVKKIMDNLRRPAVMVSTGIVVVFVLILVGWHWGGKTWNGSQNKDASQGVDLSFDISGKVSAVSKTIGDRVSVGDIITALNNIDQKVSLEQAKATLRLNQSKLSKLMSGTGGKGLDVTRSKLAGAKTDLYNANSFLLSVLGSSYSSADDAVRNKIDSFFIDSTSSNPEPVFVAGSGQDEDLGSGRVEAEAALKDIKTILSSATSTGDVSLSADKIKLDLGEIKLFTDNVSSVIDALVSSSSSAQDSISLWKTDASIARSDINGAITSLLSAENALSSAKSAYDTASKQLALDLSGAISENIEEAKAEVDQAQAGVDKATAELAKTYIKSPIDGIVTREDAKIGEMAYQNTVVVTVMGTTSASAGFINNNK